MSALPDWYGLPTYPGESYVEFTAGKVHARAMEKIEEREAVHCSQRSFIAGHAETLAGLEWSPDLFDACLELGHGYYRGQKACPKDVAKLWPKAKWKRVKSKWSVDVEYDWEALVDGVKLRIVKAESEAPRPKLKAGETIDLGLGQEKKDPRDWTCPCCGGETAGILEEGLQCIGCGLISRIREGGDS